MFLSMGFPEKGRYGLIVNFTPTPVPPLNILTMLHHPRLTRSSCQAAAVSLKREEQCVFRLDPMGSTTQLPCLAHGL